MFFFSAASLSALPSPPPNKKPVRVNNVTVKNVNRIEVAKQILCAIEGQHNLEFLVFNFLPSCIATPSPKALRLEQSQHIKKRIICTSNPPLMRSNAEFYLTWFLTASIALAVQGIYLMMMVMGKTFL